MSALHTFLSVYLPYCLRRKDDGSWLVLNRGYKPVGFNTYNELDYDAYPVSATLTGLGEATLRRLSYNGSLLGDQIYLYNDASRPTNGKVEMSEYLLKLEILSKLKIRRD